MNSTQLECFFSVAENLNFTKAASQLFISQPTVTHHIKTLENELGYALFNRENKQICLTPAGRYFYKSMKLVSDDFKNAILKSKRFGDGFIEELVVGCGSSEFEAQFLPAIIREFRQLHPNIYISFNMTSVREKISQLNEGKIDILFSTSKMGLDLTQLEYHTLRFYPFVCVTNIENKLAAYNRVSIEDLAGQDMILLDKNYAPPEIDKLQCKLENMYPQNILQYLTDVRLCRLLILCNMGIAIMPAFKYQPYEGITAIPFTGEPETPYGIAIKRESQRTYLKEFVDITKKYFTFYDSM